MSAAIIIVCIPSEKYEFQLHNKHKKNLKKDCNILSGIEPISSSSIDRSLLFSCASSSSNSRVSATLAEYKSMEKVLRSMLADLNIMAATWCKKEGHHYLQVTFSLESCDRCEEVLALLKEHNIGKLFHSTVSVIPCTIHYHGDESEEDLKDSKNVTEEFDKTTVWNRFLTSVRARLTVAEVVENVKSRAAFTFDFVCFLLISTILCAIGLVENSNIYLVSSMLISPMMGPVMAGTFGSVIQDKRLQKIGVQNELIGLGMATLVGFGYGSVICFATDKYGEHDWPTYEMTSRGELRSLWVGCLIALLSGAAVALGILSDNIASLVGVAISTSLMPPAVNAGLLWSLAAIYYIKQNPEIRYNSLTHTEIYYENELYELLALGAISVCLTFVNLVCIYLAGIIVFKIKEVAPIASKYHAGKHFWKHDIKIARDYYKTIQDGEVSNLYKYLPQEIDNFRRDNNMNSRELHHSIDLTKHNGKIYSTKHQYTWSPCTNFSKTPHIKELRQMYLDLSERVTPKTLSFDKFPKRTSKYRRLSQIFSGSPRPIRKDGEQINCTNCAVHSQFPSTEHLEGASVHQTSTKKFLVTPSTYSSLSS